MTTTTVERPHGYARYRLDGCHCNICGFAVSEYDRRREYAIRTGAWRVDGELVRAHLRSLMAAGVGRRRIAEAAGVNGSLLTRHLYGRNGRPAPATMRYDLAQKLLAVTPDLAPPARVPGIGTARRIQALVAIGWPLPELAARLGWTLANLCDRAVCRRPCVAVRNARLVADLYDRLSMTPPTGPQADRARVRARRRGWVPPLAWDDDTIDDLRATPRGTRPAVTS